MANSNRVDWLFWSWMVQIEIANQLRLEDLSAESPHLSRECALLEDEPDHCRVIPDSLLKFRRLPA